MSYRFRKSFKISKNVKLNLNKKSVGISCGVKGARFTVNSNGRKTTSMGIPGTGLYYVNSSSPKNNTKKEKTNNKNGNIDNNIIDMSDTSSQIDFKSKSFSIDGKNIQINVSIQKIVCLELLFLFMALILFFPTHSIVFGLIFSWLFYKTFKISLKYLQIKKANKEKSQKK